MATYNAKFLGKMYVDRPSGQRPNKNMLYKAVNIIQKQAPSKNKPHVKFSTTPATVSKGWTSPTSLIGSVPSGPPLVNQPLITIVSIGNQDKKFVYVTVNPLSDTMLRFWIHAYSCKTKEDAGKLASFVMSQCSHTREEFRKAKAGQENKKMSKPKALGDASNTSQGKHFTGTPMANKDATMRHMLSDENDLSMAIEAANNIMMGNDPAYNDPAFNLDKNTDVVESPSSDSTEYADHDITNDNDFQLAIEAMDEMNNLNQVFKNGYGLPEVFRGQLLDAWQRGFCEGGMVTQQCNANPSKVELDMIVTARV